MTLNENELTESLEKIEGMLEPKGWKFCSYPDWCSNKWCVDIRTVSPSKKNFEVSVFFDGSTQDFAKELRAIADGFNPDDFVDAVMEIRSVHNTPEEVEKLKEETLEMKRRVDSLADVLEREFLSDAGER